MRTIYSFIGVVVFNTMTISLSAAPQLGPARTQTAGPQRSANSALKPDASTPAARAPSVDESPATKLPVRRVILYKTGVGLFRASRPCARQ